MEFWTFVFLVTVVGCSIPLSKVWLDARASRREVDPELSQELDALKARVAVLEEIVTDGKYELRRELDRLGS